MLFRAPWSSRKPCIKPSVPAIPFEDYDRQAHHALFLILPLPFRDVLVYSNTLKCFFSPQATSPNRGGLYAYTHTCLCVRLQKNTAYGSGSRGIAGAGRRSAKQVSVHRTRASGATVKRGKLSPFPLVGENLVMIRALSASVSDDPAAPKLLGEAHPHACQTDLLLANQIY